MPAPLVLALMPLRAPADEDSAFTIVRILFEVSEVGDIKFAVEVGGMDALFP